MKSFGNYIGGKWTRSVTGKTSPNINPANRDQVVCEVQASNQQDVLAAFAAASSGFETWRKIPSPMRGQMLQQVIDAVRARQEEFARALTLENGKTLREARTELASALKEAEFQAQQGRRLSGELIQSESPDVTCYVRREPLGVATIIAPWNFPISVACRKIFPALVAGNSVVLKPADFTPMATAMMIEVFDQVGFPPGVVNFITGRGSVIGDELVTNQAVRAISFTGSTEVGLGIARKVADRQIKLQLEMGGKNPLVVLADADLDAAVDAAFIAAYACSGQWCTSTSRAIIESPVYEKFLSRICEKAAAIKVGNGLDDSTDMGPVAGPKQYDTVMRYIEIGKKEGARLMVGGNAITKGEFAKGYYIEPTVFADVASGARIAQEEIFGPVLAVMKARDFDDALAIANNTIYGLTSSIYTNDLEKAQRFVDEIESGITHVNMHTAWKEPQAEFGGIKESGRGAPEAGKAGAEFFTEYKSVYIRRKTR